jgi:hypothetical protein
MKEALVVLVFDRLLTIMMVKYSLVMNEEC